MVASAGVLHDIVYDVSRRLTLDLYPAADPAAPAVIYVHGGGFEAGDKSQHSADRIQQLAVRGLTVASVNYRLAPDAEFPGPIEDVITAGRIVLGGDHGVRPRRLGVLGVSAGGYLAAMAGLSDSAIEAVSTWYAPSDLWVSTRRSPLELQLNAVPRFENNLIPGLAPEALRGASPVHRGALKDAPPFLILHGDQDVIVSPAQSASLHDALQRHGRDSTLVRIAGAGHDDPRFNSREVLDMVAAWFLTVLGAR